MTNNNSFDAHREDFPIFSDLKDAYLDNAATSHKPYSVIEAEQTFYERYNSNPLRGFYPLSLEATNQVELARDKVRGFINAKSTKEIIFTKNATESINTAAFSFCTGNLKRGDKIVVAVTEHHSNMLPWRSAAKLIGADIEYLKCNNEGEFTAEEINRCIDERTKVVAVGIVSNVTGRTAPIDLIVQRAHQAGAVVFADGAQSVPHMKTDVQALDVDFLAFSGHKMLAAMGVGVLYGKEEILDKMPPFLTGGEMIDSVTLDEVTYAQLPSKFEAGTLNAAGIVSLGTAIDYYNSLDIEKIRQRELLLTKRAFEGLSAIPNVHIIGSSDHTDHAGILSFTVDGVHPHDVSEILSSDGICIRAGHHCAQPLLAHLGVYACSRASLMFYNTENEIDKFISSVSTIRQRMGYKDV